MGGRWKTNHLLFADDTALVAGSEEDLKRLVEEFGSVCAGRKLRVNVGKSKVVRYAMEGGGDRLDVRLDGEMLEEVENFKYFGSHVAVCGRVNVEVCYRVKEISKCMGGMKSVSCCRVLGMNAKRRLYEVVVVPTALYGAETWNVRESKRNKSKVGGIR